MRIAVVMPLYNQSPALLNAALGSILAQTWEDFHLMVFIDGANRATREALRLAHRRMGRRFSVHNAHKANRGIAATLNDAHDYIRRRGGYHAVTWVSSDNIHFPDMLETLAAPWLRDPTCRLTLGRSVNRELDTGRVYDPMAEFCAPEVAARIAKSKLVNPLDLIQYGLPPAFLYGAEYCELSYDPDMEFAEDIEFFARVVSMLLYTPGRTAQWAHRPAMVYSTQSGHSHTSFLKRNYELFIYRMGKVWWSLNRRWNLLPVEFVDCDDPDWPRLAADFDELPPRDRLLVLRCPAGEEVAWARRVLDSGRIYHCILPKEST